MQQRIVLLSMACLLVILALVTPAVAAPPTPPPMLTTLQPGAFREISQTLNINVVFVGYEAGAEARAINESAFRAQLPVTYRTVNRVPSLYSGNQFLGLNFQYNYNLVYANAAFEDAFFGYLTSIAQPQPRTRYQEQYNSQTKRSLTVSDNYGIDAPATEHWLHHHVHHDLGLNPNEYTVVFINWYGRPDFKHHVYTKTDEPDPDTGFNFGQLDSRKMIAWGGTAAADEESGYLARHGQACPDCGQHTHRLWFYDLSAGPEAWTDNWNVDDADLDGNGILDYRMPPVWEYGNLGAYRPFDNLAADLGKVMRYVALDLLFTASPLYKPAISAPLLPQAVQLDINVYQIDPATDGRTYFNLPLINSELNELQPLTQISSELNSQPFANRFAQVYHCFFNDVSCFGNRLFGIAFADLFLYHNDQAMQYLEGDGDYEVPIFAFNTTDELFTCCLGYADDNWADGTQSFVFAFDAPMMRNAGYGFSTTTIHEVGHHLGMSHPHDGYDYATNVDFGPGDAYYFAWSGDQSNSMMSYIDLNWDFSQFDFDNMNRYLTAVYLNQANSILARVYASPKVNEVGASLLAADGYAAMALAEYQLMHYGEAARHASLAYRTVVSAATQINVKIEPQAAPADYKAKGRSSKFIDGVGYPRMRP